MTMSPLPLTLCVIVRDEADVLRRCLNSAHGLVSQIVVIDTGSTDASPLIARECGAEVFTFTWRDDFSAARNAAIQQAAQPWILMLDADEVLDIDSWHPSKLSALMEQQNTLGCYVRLAHLKQRWHSNHSRPACTAIDMACRLFRNDARLQYTGRIHEDITASIEAISPAAIQWSSFTIWHDGYSPEVIQNKRKEARNLRLLHLQMEEEPTNSLWWYALGTEHFQAERYTEALPWLLRTVTTLSTKPNLPGYASDVWLKTVYTYYTLGQTSSALLLAEEAIERFPRFPDMLLLAASLYASTNQLEKAYQRAKEASTCSEQSLLYTSTDGASTWRAHWTAAFLAERIGKQQAAAHHYEHASFHTSQRTSTALLKAAAAWHRGDIPLSSWWMRTATASYESQPLQVAAARVHTAAAVQLAPFASNLHAPAPIDWATLTRQFL